MRKVIGIGETVLDIIFRNEQPINAVPGGSAFNAMISLGRCGVNSTLPKGQLIPNSKFKIPNSFISLHV